MCNQARPQGPQLDSSKTPWFAATNVRLCMKMNQWTNPSTPTLQAVSPCGLKQTRSQDAQWLCGACGLVDGGEQAWGWGLVAARGRHDTGNRANKAFKLITTAVFFEAQ